MASTGLASASFTIVLATFLRQPPAASHQPLEVFDFPPLRLSLMREPPRLSFHRGDRLLAAQRPRRESGSMELLLESGWRAVRAIRTLREVPGPAGGERTGGPRGLLADLVLEGGLEARLRIERGDPGDLLIELRGPPGTLAARDDLLRAHAERFLGVEGIRWDDPAAPPGPEDDLLAAMEGERLFLSSRGYGVLLEAPAPGGRARLHSPDPDTVRLEARGGRLAYRILPGPGPREVLAMRSRLSGRGGRTPEARSLDAALLQPIVFWNARPGQGAMENDLGLLSKAGIVPCAALFPAESGEAEALLPGRFPLSGRIARAWSRSPAAAGRVLERELPASFDGLRRAAREAPMLAVLGVPQVAFRFGAPTPRSRELALRAIELSAFLPVQVIEAGGPFDEPEVAEALARSARIRREFVAPLIERSLDDEKGLPAIRPLFLAAPHDPGAWTAADEWLIGDSLLVAPILEEGARRREVRLPAGEWEEIGAGNGGGPAFRGPSTVEAEAPLERIPAYRRS